MNKLPISDLVFNWCFFSQLLKLQRYGLLSELSEHTRIELSHWVKNKNINLSDIHNLCTFLSNYDNNYLSYDGIFVTAGKSLVTDQVKNLLHFTEAYHDVLTKTSDENLSAATLIGSATSSALNISSEIYSQKFVTKINKEILPKLSDPHTIIDLGCGSGAFLSQLEAKNIKLIGIDRGEPYRSLREQFQFIKADVKDIIDWKDRAGLGGKAAYAGCLITFMTVLHEITPTNSEFINYITSLQNHFPGAQLLFAEQSYFTDEQLNSLNAETRKLVAVYQHVHTLTNQTGLRTLSDWKSICENTHLKDITIYSCDDISHIITATL